MELLYAQNANSQMASLHFQVKPVSQLVQKMNYGLSSTLGKKQGNRRVRYIVTLQPGTKD